MSKMYGKWVPEKQNSRGWYKESMRNRETEQWQKDAAAELSENPQENCENRDCIYRMVDPLCPNCHADYQYWCDVDDSEML